MSCQQIAGSDPRTFWVVFIMNTGLKKSPHDPGPSFCVAYPSPGGFTASQLAHQVRSRSQQSASEYGPRHAAYGLKKLRGKQMVGRIEKTRRYTPIREGLRVITALLTLRDKVLQPLLAAAQQLRPTPGAQTPAPIARP